MGRWRVAWAHRTVNSSCESSGALRIDLSGPWNPETTWCGGLLHDHCHAVSGHMANVPRAGLVVPPALIVCVTWPRKRRSFHRLPREAMVRPPTRPALSSSASTCTDSQLP
eukprot:scaffold290226_cov31-Tisochrysis_lutea.AAC.1